jgi:hypothetical protein
MCETTPTPATSSAPRQPRAERLWALALVVMVILALIPLHWLLFQGQEAVPGVIARPVGQCDVEWFERRGGAIILACPRPYPCLLGRY